MARSSQFQRGSGCYTCLICGKRTRETGGGESGCNLCVRCMEVSGHENSVADGVMTPEEFRALYGHWPDSWCWPDGWDPPAA